MFLSIRSFLSADSPTFNLLAFLKLLVCPTLLRDKVSKNGIETRIFFIKLGY